MTGFLSRMAARATGQGAAATPHLPSRFEAAAVARADMPGPVLAPAEVAPRSRRRGTAAARTSEAAIPRPGAAGAPTTTDRERSGPTVRPVELVELARPTEPREPTRVEADSGRRTDDGPQRRRQKGAPPVVPDHEQGSAVVVRPTTPPVAAVVPVLPAAAAAPQLAPVAGPPAHATQRGPDVIHVSIGRVDVRAAAPSPSPAPVATSAAHAEPERVTLQGYLRGEREAR